MKHKSYPKMTAAILVLIGVIALVCYALMPIPVLSLDSRDAQPVGAAGCVQLGFSE